MRQSRPFSFSAWLFIALFSMDHRVKLGGDAVFWIWAKLGRGSRRENGCHFEHRIAYCAWSCALTARMRELRAAAVAEWKDDDFGE
jgi:hypothetical protein